MQALDLALAVRPSRAICRKLVHRVSPEAAPIAARHWPVRLRNPASAGTRLAGLGPRVRV